MPLNNQRLKNSPLGVYPPSELSEIDESVCTGKLSFSVKVSEATVVKVLESL